MNVVSLKPEKPADDVVASLRKMADTIEAGEFEFPITTALVVLAGCGPEYKPDRDNVCWTGYDLQVFGFGPRTDPFTVRGVLQASFSEV